MTLERLRAELSGEPDASMLDMVDHLLDKGCVVTGNLVLGLAQVDLIYVELSLLVCSAERLLDAGGPE